MTVALSIKQEAMEPAFEGESAVLHDWERNGMRMDLPVIRRSVGKTDDTGTVYLEAYVAYYLDRQGRSGNGDSLILYGRRERESGKDILIITGAGEEELVKKGGFFLQEKELGCVNSGLILTGDRKGGQPVSGYHIFYEDNVNMKEYLSFCYQMQKKESGLYPDSTDSPAGVSELTALSRKENRFDGDRYGESRPCLFFSLLRAAVVCIFIILCSIAVSTVNSYEKLKEFTETAAQLQEAAEMEEGREAPDTQDLEEPE